MEKPNNLLSDRKKGDIEYAQYQKEVSVRLKMFVLIILSKKDARKCKSLYNKFYSISDTVSLILLQH